MRFLYQISIGLYWLFIRTASLFNAKAKAWVEGRKDPKWKTVELREKSVIWFHCASLGEFDIALPLMEKWKIEHPSDFLVVTFFSPSGMQNYHKRKHVADLVDYIPLDTPRNARAFIDKINPKTVFFVKYEFWAFHLFAAKKNQAKLYSVNTLFRPNQIYFQWFGSFYRKILQSFNHFFVQNEGSVQLLKSISMPNASVAGDLRFDRVFQNKQKLQANPLFSEWLGEEKAFVIGSSWPKDENVLLELVHASTFHLNVIFAPHEVNEEHIAQIEQKLKITHIRYTDAEKNGRIPKETKVVLLNTIGHLTNAFQYGQMAYIGGGFSGKLHNILEPAVFGLPIFIGPKHTKFPEAQLFIDKGFCFEVKNADELKTAFAKTDKNRREIKEEMLRFMESQIGIASKIVKQLKE